MYDNRAAVRSVIDYPYLSFVLSDKDEISHQLIGLRMLLDDDLFTYCVRNTVRGCDCKNKRYKWVKSIS